MISIEIMLMMKNVYDVKYIKTLDTIISNLNNKVFICKNVMCKECPFTYRNNTYGQCILSLFENRKNNLIKDLRDYRDLIMANNKIKKLDI